MSYGISSDRDVSDISTITDTGGFEHLEEHLMEIEPVELQMSTSFH